MEASACFSKGMLTDTIQSMGGKARREALAPDERSEIAKKAAEARWSLPRATHEGELVLGNTSIPCAVLEDGTRLLTQMGFLKALGRSPRARGGEGSSIDGMVPFLAADNLKPFITKPLLRSTSPIRSRTLHGKGTPAFGYRAELLPQVCEVSLRAREQEKLHFSQRHIAKMAELIIRGLANIGIVALVDEATGYQYHRARRALAEILEQFIAKELQEWTRTFPSEFYEQIFRLRNWRFHSESVGKGHRPQVIGHYTNDIVYKRLAPGVLDELKKKNPKVDGRRRHKLFQWLTGEIGHPKLRSHIDGVLALMRVSDTWAQFRQFLKKAFPRYEKTDLGFEIQVRERK